MSMIYRKASFVQEKPFLRTETNFEVNPFCISRSDTFDWQPLVACWYSFCLNQCLVKLIHSWRWQQFTEQLVYVLLFCFVEVIHLKTSPFFNLWVLWQKFCLMRTYHRRILNSALLFYSINAISWQFTLSWRRFGGSFLHNDRGPDSRAWSQH